MLEEQHALLYGDEWSDAHARRWHDLNLDFHRQLLKLADNRWLTDAVRRACQLPIIFDSNLRPHNRDAALLLYRREQAQHALDEHRRIVEALGLREAARPNRSCASTSPPTATCWCTTCARRPGARAPWSERPASSRRPPAANRRAPPAAHQVGARLEQLRLGLVDAPHHRLARAAGQQFDQRFRHRHTGRDRRKERRAVDGEQQRLVRQQRQRRASRCR
jgi:hypothetical protein